MLNVLSFEVSKGGHDATVITPRVDGILLTTLAEQFERSRGMNDPAGGYGGLIPDFFAFGPLDQYFLGKSETPFFANRPGRIYVLSCRCGEVGCWPLTCLVSASDGSITWRAFEQPHRPARDYTSFGPFVFDLKKYEEALRSVSGSDNS